MPRYASMLCGGLCHLLKVGSIERKVVQRPLVRSSTPESIVHIVLFQMSMQIFHDGLLIGIAFSILSDFFAVPKVWSQVVITDNGRMEG